MEDTFMLASAPALGVISPSQMACLALVSLIILMFAISRARRLFAGRVRAPGARRPASRIEEERKVIEDVEAVMSRLEGCAKDIEQRLDAKFAQLEAALRKADRRLRAMEGSNESTEVKAQRGVDILVSDAPSAVSRAAVLPTVLAPANVAERLGGPVEPAGPLDGEELRRAILKLVAMGKSPHQISRIVGKSVGEIEMMLALDRRRRQLAAAVA